MVKNKKLELFLTWLLVQVTILAITTWFAALIFVLFRSQDYGVAAVFFMIWLLIVVGLTAKEQQERNKSNDQ